MLKWSEIPIDIKRHIASFYGKCEICKDMIPHTTRELANIGLMCAFCKSMWCSHCIKTHPFVDLHKRYFETWFYVCSSCRFHSK